MVEAKVTGLPDFKRALLSLPEKLRKRALRNALAAGARVVRDTAKKATPVLDVPTRRRKPGTVQKAISVRTSKRDRRAGDVGVFVNVRPAKGSARGAASRDDPFFWRFLEFGWNPAGSATGGRGAEGKRTRRRLNKSTDTKIRGGFRFLQAGANRLSEALAIFKAKLLPAIEKLNRGQTP